MREFKRFLVFIFLVFINQYCFGYEQEGFSKYEEGADGISFECDKECFIELGIRDRADYLNLDGSVGGTGAFEILGEEGKTKKEKYYLDTYILSYTGSAHVNFINYEEPLYNISRDGNLRMYFSGNLKGNLKIDKISFSFSQKFLRGRKDFWNMEDINADSINFRYGTFIRGNSIVKYGYIAFILTSLCILLIFRRRKIEIFKLIFFVGLGLFLFIGIRNTITYTSILDNGLSGFKADQTYFDFQDYIPFVNKVRDTLNLENLGKDDCKIFMKINKYHRAIDFHGDFFFKPCRRVSSLSQADYIIYYDVGIEPEDLNKKILVEYNGNYLLDNKSK